MSGQFQMPSAAVDQMAAAARDAGAGPALVDLIAEAFRGAGEGCEQAAALFPDACLSFADAAQLMFAQRDAYRQIADELRKGGAPR